ncbi:MAG: hypothetical protein AAFV29_20595, partial [Myxococcota bacterium]
MTLLPGAAQAWADALLATRLLAVDPHALGGIVVRARVGPVLRAWLEALEFALEGYKIRRL